MDESELTRRKRAWILAHKLLTLSKVVSQREDEDMLVVTTEEICRAMGQLGEAKLEEVREFVQDVVCFMQGYGLNIVCGCGYLSLLVSESGSIEQALQEGRELTSFTPGSLDGYLDAFLLDTTSSPANPAPQICDFEIQERED